MFKEGIILDPTLSPTIMSNFRILIPGLIEAAKWKLFLIGIIKPIL